MSITEFPSVTQHGPQLRDGEQLSGAVAAI